jgi:hypothetical protein
MLRMKIRPPFLVFLLLCWWQTFSMVYADTFIPRGTPNIDGHINPGEWSEMSHVRMARFYGFDQFADFWLQWDHNNLYIAGYLQDYTLFEDAGGSGEPWETWQDDSIEIYLRPGHNPPSDLDEHSRVLAFSITGRQQRLDRGRWGREGAASTGLEIFGKTNPKIGNAFLNSPIRWVDDCPIELESPPKPEVTVRFASVPFGTINNNGDRDIGWQFEVALPWALMGTSVDKKIVGENCAVGDAIIPVSPNPQDGMPLRINFYRVNDDNGNEVKTEQGEHPEPNRLGEKTPNGLQVDEWFVYQGDRNSPNEWETFVLSAKAADDVPQFESQDLGISPLDGRRVQLHFQAPKRGHAGGAANRYLIRFKEGAMGVDDNVWNGMHPFVNAYQPAEPGTRQTLEVIGLQPNTEYTIALRAQDETGRQSREILSQTIKTNPDSEPFVTVSPTGRNLVLTDGSPFVVVGETGLMPWLPLRGLYTGELCDEHPPGDSDFRRQKQKCGQGLVDNTGKAIDGRMRNYNTEKLFFICHLQNGQSIAITDITEFGKDSFKGPKDNCDYVARGAFVTDIEPVEGPEVAKRYLRKLKAAGVNTLTVFAESLDLDATPILFEEQKTHVFNFLDHLLKMARDNNVYLLIRLYDTYYYKDDKYKVDGQKWAKTLWAKYHGKTLPAGFFDEDVYQTHFDRMNELFRHVNRHTGIAYRDDPHILGWDLLNEIDNKDRFNEATYAKRKKWVETMLAHTKREAPRQLAFFSFLTWDPKDDKSHYRENLGMDADLAYRASGASIAVAHGYYGHVSNPYAIPSNIDYEGPMELTRGTIYGFYQIRDGRPIIDGEAAPDPLFIKEGDAFNEFFTEESDMKRFYNSAWLHFAAGGAGANLHWPIDLRPANGEKDRINQIPPEKRAFLTIFKNNVGDMLWRGDLMQIAHRRVNDDLVQVSRYDEQNAVVFMYNRNAQGIGEVTLSELPMGTGHVKVINPRNNQVVYDKPNIPIGAERPIRLDQAVSDSVAVMVRNMVLEGAAPASTGGIIADRVWIKAVLKFPDIPDSEALWHLGGDETKNGNRAVWGYFYANPDVFDWGDANNPEIFVKVWVDQSGRIDVNFFHVSGPDIEVFSGLKEMENGQTNRVTQAERYARHTYEQGNLSEELLSTPEVAFVSADANPRHHAVPVRDRQIGAIIHTEDKGAIEAAWRFGGSSTTTRGDQVAWGFFHADPNDVGWGFANNPDVYVKVWYDIEAKRVDVNFFHISVPNISVYSGFLGDRYEFGSQVTMGERYTRHVYQE